MRHADAARVEPVSLVDQFDPDSYWSHFQVAGPTLPTRVELQFRLAFDGHGEA